MNLFFIIIYDYNHLSSSGHIIQGYGRQGKWGERAEQRQLDFCEVAFLWGLQRQKGKAVSKACTSQTHTVCMCLCNMYIFFCVTCTFILNPFCKVLSIWYLPFPIVLPISYLQAFLKTSYSEALIHPDIVADYWRLTDWLLELVLGLLWVFAFCLVIRFTRCCGWSSDISPLWLWNFSWKEG